MASTAVHLRAALFFSPGLAIGILVAIIVAAARIVVVGRYGNSLPFWDQWGAEANLLYRPILGGTFEWSTLWQAHSEHRIFFTRVLAIAIFYANQMQWDGMVQAYANAVLVAVAVGAASSWAWKRFDPATGLVFSLGLVSASVIPVGWENTITGFQNCFYFVAIFSLAAISVAATASREAGYSLLVAGLCVAAYFSLGSGLLVVPVVLLIIFVRYLRREWTALEAFAFAVPTLISGAVETVNSPFGVHSTLHAENFNEFLAALLLASGWPFPIYFGFLLWIPLLLWLAGTIVKRESSSQSLLLAGIAAWALLAAAAIAYSRGHGLLVIQSRYVDNLAFGAIANSALAMHLIGTRLPDRLAWQKPIAAAILVTMVGFGIYCDWSAHSFVLVERSGRMRIASANVARYISGSRDILFNQPTMHIPVAAHEASILGAALDDSIVRSFLPFSVARAEDLQPTRYCKWDSGLFCGNGLRESDVSAVGVGPLSAASYQLWRRTGVAWIKPLRLSQGLSSVNIPMNCQFEMVNEQQRTDPDYQLTFSGAIRIDGWAGPRLRDIPLRLSFISSDGQRYDVEFNADEARPDVVEFLKDDEMAFSGFHVWVDASALPIGTYLLAVSSKESADCKTGRTITLAGDVDQRRLY